MAEAASFADFRDAFFGLFEGRSFRGNDYLGYLGTPSARRGNDEAPIVDTAIVGPLLGLLGFEPAERVYNQTRQSDRPDFAPMDAVYGTCFMVEDKNTALALTLDITDPDSHLSQLARYVRAAAVRLGWLTNGQRLMVWRFDDPDAPHCVVDLDIPAAIREWADSGQSALSPAVERSLNDLYDLCRRSAFTDAKRLEDEIAISPQVWQQRALALGEDAATEQRLVEAVQTLVGELQRDARRTLSAHLERYATYADRITRLTDDAHELARARLDALRAKVIVDLEANRALLGLDSEEISRVGSLLRRAEADARAFTNPKALLAEVLTIINAARQRKYIARPWSNLNEMPSLRDDLQAHINTVLDWHQRQATLRQTYRADIGVHDDFMIWTSLVQETMLGGLDEEQRRDEFALQAAYVVFIRLLLIRVCEDKGIFPERFVSDGGLEHWRRNIPRYLPFANGNPYDPLLDMAYLNAQNIYAHFFTGRELFNWYRLDRQRLVMALHQLSRFDFAGVDSDIVGTIYNTYVSRKEKREKGQYYTPPEIVNYILDEVGYVSGPGIIGPNRRLIDPACGSGSFLVAAAKRLVAAYQGMRERVDDPVAVLDRVRNSLYGFDLNPFACYLAEVNLLIQVLDLVKLAHGAGARPKLQRFHIYNVDALTRASGRYFYAHFDTLLAEETDEVDRIKRRAPGTEYAPGFAFVVANPPYGAKLSDEYKAMLRQDWADVFFGQPDTYTFFLKLAVELLGPSGRLGFITPNTYLMGTNSGQLRAALMAAGRIDQIVDLPQGIWPDANVDCVLLFLTADANEESRRSQIVRINLLNLHDTLSRLTAHDWAETLMQPQSGWMDHLRREMNIRHDALLERIEDACRVPINGGLASRVLRLGDVTESTQGIIPYETRAETRANSYIRLGRDVSYQEADWKPLLDGRSFVGRYEIRWSPLRPHIKYGSWLCRPRERKFFESPKLLFVRLRNRALKRRLVASLDDTGFFNRHNFSNVIQSDLNFSLEYVLALFNSSLLNFWYGRQYPDVEISIADTRQLPVFPAEGNVQSALTALVDELLAKHAALNELRNQGYSIRRRPDGSAAIEVPHDILISELQRFDPHFPTLPLFDARAAGMVTIPARCDLQATVSSNVYTPERYPTTVVLRHNKLWLEVPDDDLRRFLRGYLGRPQWRGHSWDSLKDRAVLPADAGALAAFFAAEASRIAEIQTTLAEIARVDETIDDRVLDLYGINDPADRQRILGSAPRVEDDEAADADPSDMAPMSETDD
jgi:type I restriction enzyme M protein